MQKQKTLKEIIEKIEEEDIILTTRRQSDRMRAIQFSEKLKNRTLSKKFLMTEFVNILIS